MKRLLSLSAAVFVAVAVQATVSAHDGDPKYLDRKPAFPGKGWRNAQLLQAPPSMLQRGTQPIVGSSALGGDPSQFAHSNVTLFSWVTLPDFGLPSNATGASCYGYVSPSGREYALMGHSGGMSIVEITQPGNPVIVATIVGNASLWRDVRTYGQYAYVSTEAGGGIQVVDLANVDGGVAPLVNTIMTGGSGNTHTLEINQASGFMYRSGGAGNGLRIYDLNQSAVNPPYVGAWSDKYVHEAQIVSYPGREIAICCGGLNNGYLNPGIDIVDVTNKALPQTLFSLTYGQASYSHQAYLSPDRQFLYHNDETDGRPYTRVFNASQLGSASPSLTYLGEFQNGPAVDHNLYTKGNLIYESNYRSGLRVFDRTASSVSPTLTAFFDTYPEDDASGYNGLWSNYPYFPSGVVIGSDMERGLFVWWVGAPQLTISHPDGLPVTLDPAGQAVRVRIVGNVAGQLVAGSAKLWTSTGGAWTSSNLVPIAGNDFAAVFPAVPCGTTVNYYVAAQSQNGIVWVSPEAAPAEFESAPAAYSTFSLASYDFEASGGFQTNIAGDTATGGVWARVNPIATLAQPEDDHSPTGSACWVTQNGFTGGAEDAADVDGGSTTLRSPNYDMTGPYTWVVSYWRWYSNDQGGAPNTDVFRVDVSTDGGSAWVNVDTIGPTGPDTSGGWRRDEFVINQFVTPTTTTRFRFVASDTGVDSTVEAAIDDIQITRVSCSGTRVFCAGDGSATPCPCGNVGASGAGCANSLALSGRMSASGNVIVGADTLLLSTDQVGAGAPLVFFQGTAALNSEMGAQFGDGLFCVSGSIMRLGLKFSDALGVARYPEAGDSAISVAGFVGAGSTRYYQSWYRDAGAFCTSATNNLSNGVAVAWR